jgi:hypothetical protein
VNDHHAAGRENTLLRRMQAADPAQTTSPAATWSRDLAQAAMNTTPAPKAPVSRWAPALAAAAAIALIGGATYAALDGTGQTEHVPDPTVTTLAMPGGGTNPSMRSCIPFEVRHLREMPVAFSGTATSVGGTSVTLEVGRWYKGGSADVVELANYDPSTVSLDGLEFVQGDRYLVAASDGAVVVCGFSGPWSHRLANAFAEAFGP